MTLAGLNTVNLSTLNTFQQVLLFFLIIFGSAVSDRFIFPTLNTESYVQLQESHYPLCPWAFS
jgi:hypothetical protein